MNRTYGATLRQYADAMWIADEAAVVAAAEKLSDEAQQMEELWEVLLERDLEPTVRTLVAEHARTMAALSNSWHVVATTHRRSPAAPV